MKATGIVRRIDELGRVVIPKEIRRTLRIREGDALEIYTDREGGVILKKYSLVGELCDFAKEYAESIQQSVGHIAAICDKDTIIAISSPHRRDIAIGSPLAVDKPIHDDVEAVMQMREKLNRSTANGDAMIGITQNDEQGRAYTAQLIIPILAAGDAIGAVMLLSALCRGSEDAEKSGSEGITIAAIDEKYSSIVQSGRRTMRFSRVIPSYEVPNSFPPLP